jgi:hypothetical protein
MILFAVFLLSLSSLSFEVLLTRIFSISQWNHLSFMVISMALFGFAASGTFLSILDTRQKGWEHKLSTKTPVIFCTVLFALTAIASFIILNNIPIDYFRLPLEPIQGIYLLIAYLLLSLPFFFTGLIVSIAYAALPEKTGYVYFASMAGSGCGAIIPVPALHFLSEGHIIIITAMIPMIIFSFIFTKRFEKQNKSQNFSRAMQTAIFASGITIIIIAVILLSPIGSQFVKVQPSAYKSLSQILQFPHTHITETANSIRGRIDKIKSPYIRFAAGLSLKYTDRLPEQSAVFRDGDNQFVFYNLLTQEDASFAKFTLTYSGYILAPNPEHVLLIQQGGGLGIPCALAAKAGKITVVEQNPNIARIVHRHYSLPVVNRNPRAFLAQSKKRFNIIQIENWGTSFPGAATLNQDHYFTHDAFNAYLKHLTDDGILIISRKLLLPPSDAIRLWAVAFESLRTFGFNSPDQHIAMLRNWDTFTLIVSARPLIDVAQLRDFAKNLNFDLVYLPNLTQDMVNRFAIFDAPYHFLEINRLAQAYRSGNEKEFFNSHFLDIAPQSDSRPFPARFLKWTRISQLYKSTGSRLYALIMSGEIVVSVVLIEAFAISFFLLALPLIFIRNSGNKPSGKQIIYFLSVGAGFMFVELYFIKQFILLFGDPVISFTVVLSGILIFSSMGGFYSQQIGKRGLRKALVILIVVLTFIFWGLETTIQHILGVSTLLQYLLAFLILAPPGILLGLPFSLGMRHLLESPVERAYAWTANGCTSVITSIISAQIALSFGIATIIASAALAYFFALICSGNR